MRPTMFRAPAAFALAAFALAAFAVAATEARATELQVLSGVPSAKQIEDALAPAQAASTVRYRGITLGNQPPPAAGSAAPAKPPVQASAAIAINIVFDFDSDKLTAVGTQVLDNLGAALKSERLSGQRFLLEGHTDSKGADAYNQGLSERRAQAAKDYLVAKHGIAQSRLATVGKGKFEPLDPANPEAAVNRRVQVMNLGS